MAAGRTGAKVAETAAAIGAAGGRRGGEARRRRRRGGRGVLRAAPLAELHVLVNGAGIVAPRRRRTPVERWDEVFAATRAARS